MRFAIVLLIGLAAIKRSRKRLEARSSPGSRSRRSTASSTSQAEKGTRKNSRVPLLLNGRTLAGGLLGSPLRSPIGLEVSLTFPPVRMAGLEIARKLRLGGLEASAGSGLCRRRVDGDGYTSHETRDARGKKNSLQHGLLRFVFRETRCAVEGMSFNGSAARMFRRAGVRRSDEICSFCGA